MTNANEYTVVIVQLDEEDGGGYFGFVPDLPGCCSDGDTREEAVKNTEEALVEWLDTQLRRGREIPEPGSAIEAAEAREQMLKDAIRSLADYNNDAEEKVASLEAQLRDLILVLKDENGRLPGKYVFASAPNIPKKLAH